MKIFRLFGFAAMVWTFPCQPAAGQSPASTAKAAAPVDFTGYWVAFVTEDWRFRMVTPRKGDYRNVPMTEEAVQVADAWDPGADEASGNQCRSYGAAAIMRLAARFHITWQDENTLQVASDAGEQTRLFHFGSMPARPGERTWQGYSRANWEMPASLKVVTTSLRSGYLRKNGVPYSENAVVTEYFDLAPLPAGGEVLLVTTIVDDPQYLREPFIVSSQFKKEADGSKWDPTPCTAR
ncbi:MAG TPA: hypothetical protein VMB25_22080 [Bryobacteraceae bacterium]|nr:hypothetical protein [Bryobacteraceae bacterium]